MAEVISIAEFRTDMKRVLTNFEAALDMPDDGRIKTQVIAKSKDAVMDVINTFLAADRPAVPATA